MYVITIPQTQNGQACTRTKDGGGRDYRYETKRKTHTGRRKRTSNCDEKSRLQRKEGKGEREKKKYPARVQREELEEVLTIERRKERGQAVT